MRKQLAAFAAILLLAACGTDSSYQNANVGGGGKPMLEGVADSTGRADFNVSDYGTSLNPAVAGLQAQLEQEVGAKVLFGYDSSSLSSTAKDTLTKQAQWFQQYPDLKILVEGHCDERGTREYNLALGERRANAIRSYLNSQGLSSSRIETISYGKERPAVAGAGEDVWSQNRRGMTVIQ